jgi:hypothetical protein
MKKKSFIAVLIGAYLATTGISYAVASTLIPGPSGAPGQPNRFSKLISPLVPTAGKGAVTIDQSAPKTEECPINGKLYTVAERDSWNNRTPIAIMIENSVDARPQSGLSQADIVYEAIAEGGITRFMAVMYCDVQAADTILAPVRSARTYFIDWASTYQEPLYTHVGGANLPGPSNALGQLDDYGWVGKNNLNQFSIGFPTFARNYDRITLPDGKELATEHTMETSTERLWKYAQEKRKITSWAGKAKFDAWAFKEDASSKGTVSAISYEFWDGFKDFAVKWNYDAASNTYARVMADQPHLDLNNNQQIKSKNVVVMFTTEKGPINENKHMLYGTTGTGKALIFMDGQAVDGTWSKASRVAPLKFMAKGKEIELNRGQTWISVVATGTAVAY